MGTETPPPIRSLGEASSFTVRMRSFQGHVYTGPAGVRVSVCRRSLPQGATPASPPESLQPCCSRPRTF